MSINPLDWLRRPISDLANVPPPWPSSAASVYAQVLAAVAAGEPGETLELSVHHDETADDDEGRTLRWAAGARDALFGAPDTSDVSARRLVSALGGLVRRPSRPAFEHLYELARTEAIGVVDEALEQLARSDLDRDAVATIGRRLAREAPDVEPVKLGIALIGVAGAPDDAALLCELGRYDELTVYAAVAVRNLLDPAEAEPRLRALATGVHGWGRIRIVGMLRDTTDPETRSWLLREGYRNDIMIEETAWICATAGGLLEALQAPAIDDDMLEVAANLIEALLSGGPAEDMDDYADGPEACRLFLQHLVARPALSAKRFVQVQHLRDWVADAESDWAGRKRLGWTAEARWNLRLAATAWLDRPEWPAVVEAALLAEGFIDFWYAANAAKALGIDPWPHRLRRQRDGVADEWWGLMQTKDTDRVEQVLALARQQLDLSRVGSGPTRSLGLGLDYAADSACDFIVQELREFPGVGVDFVKLALRGRSIRLRNMGLKALETWGREHWPSDAEAWLQAAAAREPDARVADSIANLLADRPLD